MWKITNNFSLIFFLWNFLVCKKHLVTVKCWFCWCNFPIYPSHSCVLCSIFLKRCTMGKKAELDNAERSKIVSMILEGLNTVEIAKPLQRDHRIIKLFIQDSIKFWSNGRRGILKVSNRERTHLTIAMKNNAFIDQQEYFHGSGYQKWKPNTYFITSLVPRILSVFFSSTDSWIFLKNFVMFYFKTASFERLFYRQVLN